MQDLETGEMVPLNPRQMKMVQEMTDDLEAKRTLLQKAKDEAIPDRSRQGPIFTVGEELIIKGGKFKVHAITDKRIYLDSLPSDHS